MHAHPIVVFGGSVGAYAAVVLGSFIVRLDARGQPGDESATDDEAFETLTPAHYGHGRVPISYEERQDFAQRSSPTNLGGLVNRVPEFTLVALGQPGDLLGFG